MGPHARTHLSLVNVTVVSIDRYVAQERLFRRTESVSAEDGEDGGGPVDARK